MQQTSTGFTLVKLLAPGVYQYKFIVDGEWRYAADQPAILDEMGNVNNVVEVRQDKAHARSIPTSPGPMSAIDEPEAAPFPASWNCVARRGLGRRPIVQS